MIAVGTGLMSKKKPGASKPIHLGASKPIIVAIRGSEAFKDWVERYAQKNRISVAQAVERALVIAAEQDRFEAPPPR